MTKIKTSHFCQKYEIIYSMGNDHVNLRKKPTMIIFLIVQTWSWVIMKLLLNQKAVTGLGLRDVQFHTYNWENAHHLQAKCANFASVISNLVNKQESRIQTTKIVHIITQKCAFFHIIIFSEIITEKGFKFKQHTETKDPNLELQTLITFQTLEVGNKCNKQSSAISKRLSLSFYIDRFPIQEEWAENIVNSHTRLDLECSKYCYN